MVTIQSVEYGSLAHKAGICAGDILISVNGNNISDVLDYRFYLVDRNLSLLLHRGPDLITIEILKKEYDDIGLEFETYLMDKKQTCRNKCIFCFIDQLPHGMRDTLYFKDDDSRLSFLMGNYITLTNLTDGDIDRIIKMHMSPINISVHTTNPELRCKMLHNRFAGDSLRHLKRLCIAGISVNLQIVRCKGVNDGAELDRTLTEFAGLGESVNNVAIVPAGLTK
ncbi:MAG: PDZ domain-containing protein, partial [Clostridia bacterium]|nr:PDZ domain-containing protein [Clostridia bacterium]